MALGLSGLGALGLGFKLSFLLGFMLGLWFLGPTTDTEHLRFIPNRVYSMRGLGLTTPNWEPEGFRVLGLRG